MAEMTERRIRVVAVPRPAWRPYFECLVVEHLTFACSNLAGIRDTLTGLAAVLDR